MPVETPAKFLELAAKFAWPTLFMLAFTLLASEQLAKDLGIHQIRSTYRGYLWLGLVFSGAVALGGIRQSATKLIWRYGICPLKKLLFPIRDHHLGIAQSRMRYYSAEVTSLGNIPVSVFQEVDSNGNVRCYRQSHGERFVPPEQHVATLVAPPSFVHPAWAKVDWRDVFNGDIKSGCWGISQP